MGSQLDVKDYIRAEWPKLLKEDYLVGVVGKYPDYRASTVNVVLKVLQNLFASSWKDQRRCEAQLKDLKNDLLTKSELLREAESKLEEQRKDIVDAVRKIAEQEHRIVEAERKVLERDREIFNKDAVIAKLNQSMKSHQAAMESQQAAKALLEGSRRPTPPISSPRTSWKPAPQEKSPVGIYVPETIDVIPETLEPESLPPPSLVSCEDSDVSKFTAHGGVTETSCDEVTASPHLKRGKKKKKNQLKRKKTRTPPSGYTTSGYGSGKNPHAPKESNVAALLDESRLDEMRVYEKRVLPVRTPDSSFNDPDDPEVEISCPVPDQREARADDLKTVHRSDRPSPRQNPAKPAPPSPDVSNYSGRRSGVTTRRQNQAATRQARDANTPVSAWVKSQNARSSSSKKNKNGYSSPPPTSTRVLRSSPHVKRNIFPDAEPEPDAKPVTRLRGVPAQTFGNKLTTDRRKRFAKDSEAGDKPAKIAKAEKPREEEPVRGYKFQRDPVRNREDRNKLPAFACRECEEYVAQEQLTPRSHRRRVERICKHRGQRQPDLPGFYFDMSF